MSNNNVSDGPIPFFSSADDNQANFLSGTNITDNSTQSKPEQSTTQSTQPAQPAQQSQQSSNTTVNPSVQDVSSLFGNNKEDSFLSAFNTPASGTTDNNKPVSSNFQNSNNFYNPQVNRSTASLRSLSHQPYSTPYLPKSDSNPQSIHSSSSYTNLSSYNQTNDTSYYTNTSNYVNNTIANKSPYIPSPEPSTATYNNNNNNNNTIIKTSSKIYNI